MTERTERILITGAAGQIGSELTLALRNRYGAQNVVASDKHAPKSGVLQESGSFEIVDVLDRGEIERVVDHYRIDTIYHMAAILSAAGEEHPQLAWDVNTGGLYNVLEIARERRIARIFSPSSIAVFGPETPHDCAPQETILRPTTIYGVSKVAGELLGNYYVHRFGLDVRGLRYPGIISSETPPGGGTTDYAVAIFYNAIEEKGYTCFVREDTVLPMMYMPDCIKATIDLMEADPARLVHHCDFNLAGMSFSAGELATEIKKHIPEFICHYAPDTRQEIADTWPQTIDDRAAREEWSWKPSYDLASMTTEMISRLDKRQQQGNLY
ncbi:NAD-dependent epimerase/dehydratase family protein [Candidatus Bipolaricaulota bacterium]|nr:NAD-dependent epimerase/dehydratase family protein [Candidatus Bipolaricaulota bacterium]